MAADFSLSYANWKTILKYLDGEISLKYWNIKKTVCSKSYTQQ
jgi:hypothetical protein